MLIRCPECGNQVSDKAEICPHCGIKIAGNPEVTTGRAAVIQQTEPGTGKPTPTSPPPAPPVCRGRATLKGKEQGSGKSNAVWIASVIIAMLIFAVGFYFYQTALEDKEQEAYEYALETGDVMVMQNYLSRYQDAPREHRDSINAVIERIRHEDQEWYNAVNSGSRNVLLQYIEQNPDSPHLSEARNKIDSIDYCHAMREYKSSRSVQALQDYLAEHPNGRYASSVQDMMDELRSTEVSPEELAMAKGVCRKFLQAINSRDERKLVATVTEIMDSFLNRAGATNNDVVTFMNRIYKDDITNMNWYMQDDFKAEKVEKPTSSPQPTPNPSLKGGEPGGGIRVIRVQFGAEQHIDRTDPNKERKAKYIISADVTPEGLISSLNMKKVAISE